MARLTKERTRELQELALTFYLSDTTITQKEVAQKTGVGEKTISKWIQDGKWDERRQSMLVTKKTQLQNLYEQLEAITNNIKTRKVVYDVPAFLLKPVKMKDADGAEYLHYHQYNEQDYPVKIGNTPTPREADIISKITASINRLEVETGAGETIEVGLAFMRYMKNTDLEFTKTFTQYFDAYIKTKI